MRGKETMKKSKINPGGCAWPNVSGLSDAWKPGFLFL